MVKTRSRRSGKNLTLISFAITFIAVALILGAFAAGYPTSLNRIIGIITLLISVYLCYVYRYNTGLLLVMLFIAYTNFSIVVGVYLDPSLRPGFIYRQFDDKTFGVGIICIFIFEVLMLIFSHRLIKNPHLIDFHSQLFVDNVEHNSIIAVGAIAAYLLLFFTSFNIGIGSARGGSSALNEYRTIIAIIGGYYSGRKKAYKYIWTIVIGLTSILILLSGNRVDMFGSAIFLIFFWYVDFFDYKKILLLIPVAVILLAGVGFLRGSFSLGSFSASQTISTLLGDRLTYEGAIYGYGPSLATIELAKTTVLSEKITLLWNHITYVFTLGAAGSSNPDLSLWSRRYYTHYWGFISPCYFYFWVSYLGPVIYAGLVNLYVVLYRKNTARRAIGFKNKTGYILSLYFITNVARWYAYGPMGLLRGMFVCLVAFAIVYGFDRIIKGKFYRVNRGGVKLNLFPPICATVIERMAVA